MDHSDQPSGRSARDIAFDEAEAFLADIGRTPVDASASVDAVVAALDGPLPVDGSAPSVVVEELVDALRPGLVASSGPRYFGFVTGGALESTPRSGWRRRGTRTRPWRCSARQWRRSRRSRPAGC